MGDSHGKRSSALLNVLKGFKHCDLVVSRNPLLAGHILVWSVYLFSCLVTPAKSLYEDTHARGVFLIVSYVVLSVAGALLLMAVFPKRAIRQEPAEKMSRLYDYLKPHRLILLTSLLVLCGLLLHLYDKVFIMKIDYSAGIAKARHQWLAHGTERGGGISSWQSAAGHILVNFHFIVMAMVLVFWKELPKAYKYLGYVVSVTAILIYSGSIGSRSVPLFFLLYVISIMLLSKSLGRGFLPKGFRFLFVLLVFLFFAYNLFVFHERGKVFGSSPKQYTESFYSHLGGKEDEQCTWGENLPGFLSEIYYYTILTTIYINHNQWTFDYVLTLKDRPGQSLMNTLYGGLVKVGLLPKERVGNRAFSGVFLSLPGCAYYDYGVWGMIIIAILHGTFIFAANRMVRGHHLRVGFIFFYLLVGVFSLVSPLTSAANLMIFPYMVISYVCLPFFVILVKLPVLKRDGSLGDDAV